MRLGLPSRQAPRLFLRFDAAFLAFGRKGDSAPDADVPVRDSLSVWQAPATGGAHRWPNASIRGSLNLSASPNARVTIFGRLTPFGHLPPARTPTDYRSPVRPDSWTMTKPRCRGLTEGILKLKSDWVHRQPGLAHSQTGAAAEAADLGFSRDLVRMDVEMQLGRLRRSRNRPRGYATAGA